MAKKIVVELIDDTDASKAETVSFSLDGVSYEIDLSQENAAQLRSELSRWVSSARKASGARRVASKPTRSTSDAAATRTWARGKGIEVSERGRIPAEIRAQYLADISGS